MLSSVIRQVSDDALALGCLNEVESCRQILERGSSADYQIRAFRADNDVSAANEWIASATAPGQTRRQAPPWQEAVV